MKKGIFGSYTYMKEDMHGHHGSYDTITLQLFGTQHYSELSANLPLLWTNSDDEKSPVATPADL